MGTHISVVKILGFEPYEDYGNTIMLVNKEKQDWFSTVRYSGDTQFNDEVEFNYIDVPDKDEILKRPVDFDAAEKWVKENVYEANQSRLIYALKRMREDENLCFDVSC